MSKPDWRGTGRSKFEGYRRRRSSLPGDPGDPDDPDEPRDFVTGHSELTLAEWNVARRGVAQPGSALALGARGPRFESGRPDHSAATSSVLI
jgi:hypothetical protein